MNLIKLAFVLLVCVTGALSIIVENPLVLATEWKNIDYKFPSDAEKQAAISSGRWVIQNQVPFDVNPYYYGNNSFKIFITIPRLKNGVPITLGTVSLTEATANGPIIIPYPNYSWHSAGGANCDGIVSVFRIDIDKFSRLWVLDSGKIGDTQYCQPQLLVFNLKDDSLIRRYRFPAGVYRPTSLFVTPIVDVVDSIGADTNVYIADPTGFGVVIYSYKNNVSWRAQNKLFYPDIRYSTITISGESFDLMDGVVGMAVSPPIGAKLATKYSTAEYPVLPTDRLLYFHSAAGATENIVPLRHLNNKTLWDANVQAVPRAFIEIGSRDIQSVAQAMDRLGNLFLGLNTPNGIACWDSNEPYNRYYINVRATSETDLQYASGVKIVTNPYGTDEIWTLTCRYQKVMAASMNFTETNFRIFASYTKVLMNYGVRCS